MNCVSIMVVTYNRIELTKRMFESLYKHTDVPYRLIIVDNGSTDGTIEWLQAMPQDQKLCQSYDIHYNKKNLGIASGRNIAMQLSDKYKDNYLSTIDNDIEFVPNWLSKCIDVLSVNPKLAIGLNMEEVEYPIMELNGKSVQFKKAGNLGTACTVFHQKLHEEIGFFVSYGLYGEEDSDFFIRARVAGYSMGYLIENGIHFGCGENDIGEYREWKTKMHAENLPKFRQACMNYYHKKTPIYVPNPFLGENE